MSARTSTWGGTEADVTGSAPSGRGERRVRRRLPDGAGNQRRRPARRARRARRTAAEAASTASEAARTLLRDGLSPYGADSLWLWQWVDHGCLRLAGYAGIGAAEAAAWQWILRGAPGPFRAVLAEGTPVCSRRDRPPPGEILPGPSAQAARALLPLFRRGKQVGRALVGWPGPTALDGTLRRALAGLLDVGGAALDTADAVRPAVSAPVLVDVLDSLAHPAALLRFTAPPGRRPSTI